MNFVLNYKSGSPIAIIKGGKNNGKIIYWCDKDKLICDEKKENFEKDNNIIHKCTCNNIINDDEDEILGLNFYKHVGKRDNYTTINKLREHIKNRDAPDAHTKMGYLYKKGLQEIDQRQNKEIIISDGGLYPLFNINMDREVFYISGMGGSGKSTYISYLMKAYNLLYPDNNIYLFSNKTEDDAFKNRRFVRIEMNEEIVDKPIELTELKNSFVIFDDYEYNIVKSVEQALLKLSNLILNQGRSYKINFAFVSHLTNNYTKTKNILAEMNNITIFPCMTSAYSLDYLLKRYFGFSKEQIYKIIHLPSRWVTIYKCPFIVLYSNGVYIV